jgi:hypothetical protein
MRITPCTKLYVFKIRYAREKIGVGGVSLSSSVVSLFRPSQTGKISICSSLPGSPAAASSVHLQPNGLGKIYQSIKRLRMLLYAAGGLCAKNMFVLPRDWRLGPRGGL